METPVFEEIDPASDCDCPGCRHPSRVPPYSAAGRTAIDRRAARRAFAVVATASAACVAAALPAAAHAPVRPGVPADEERVTPQGPQAPLHGPGGSPAAPTAGAPLPETTRTEIIERAKKWVAEKVPYSMTAYWSDGYRQDCSGYVSMAWGLPANEWTGSLGKFSDRITKDELQPGDILLFHNQADPEKGSHVVIFGGWTDQTRNAYTAYEQTPPNTRRKDTPYAYWNNSSKYLPYRYKGVVAGVAGGAPAAVPAAYPGASSFGPGANNGHVARLGRLLVERGGARFYTSGPGPRWGEADRRAVEAFQRAQGWRGAAADGLPGPRTWSLLVSGKGKEIPPGKGTAAASHGVPGYPGRAGFRPGAVGDHVTRLGKRLVAKGYGRFYTSGPGPRWGEADRRAVEAFQRAQGWRGGAADGFPGPETWRRLFT
ncbi:peptidoglycan-binding protein [Streptomyces sp. CRN 30]|uniref:peptidoglycan-binding protein n=1 Tax=Streptomyces sp. CRN 30 TaxID=3075613 RepID=UPI002A82A6CC|nr:peptidoglycan-binding protein [Streptomyces sp. CRN 30]